MMGQLVTLPLRLTVRTASLFLRGSEEVLKRALALTGRPVEAQQRYGTGTHEPSSDGDGEPPRPTSSDDSQRTETRAPAASAPAPVETQPAEPEPLTEQPTHVSEEPQIVAEFAEPGAEEGAGAEVRIEEPWPGYAQMNAKEVIARIGDASSAELAALNLYESANQARQTVLSAVERQLQLANRGSASN